MSGTAHKPSDEALRRAWASLPAAEAQGCPPADQVLRCALGDGTADEVLALSAHLAGCGRCAQSWRLAAALREPEPVAQVVPLRARRSAAWAALAAAAAVVAVGVVLRSGEGPDALRGEARSALHALVSEAPASACTLQWSALPGATYDLTVTRASGALLFRVEGLRDASVEVPAAALQPTTAGEQVFWRVAAKLDDGSSVTSQTFPLTLR